MCPLQTTRITILVTNWKKLLRERNVEMTLTWAQGDRWQVWHITISDPICYLLWRSWENWFKLTWTSNATLRYDSSLLVRRLRAHSRNNSRGTCFQIQTNGTIFVTLKIGQEDHHHQQTARQAARNPCIATSDRRRLLLIWSTVS